MKNWINLLINQLKIVNVLSKIKHLGVICQSHLSFCKFPFNPQNSGIRFSSSKAFTLAEVLITLGIIGIVAEITIPILIHSFQKQTVVAYLQKFYSNTSQAIKLSEAENGKASEWTYPLASDAVTTTQWFNTYLAPYMKYNSISNSGTAIKVEFLDGTFVKIDYHGSPLTMHFNYSTNSDTVQSGKNYFTFWMSPTTSNPYSFAPYGSLITSRSSLLSNATYGCNKSATRGYCAALIMADGWQIMSDYPYFN